MCVRTHSCVSLCVHVWQSFVLFETMPGGLVPHLLLSFCNCSFGALSLALSLSPSLSLSSCPPSTFFFFLFCPHSLSFLPAWLIMADSHLPIQGILSLHTYTPTDALRATQQFSDLLVAWTVCVLSPEKQLCKCCLAKKRKQWCHHFLPTVFLISFLWFLGHSFKFGALQHQLMPFVHSSLICRLLTTGYFSISIPLFSLSCHPAAPSMPVSGLAGLLWRIMDVASCSCSAAGHYHRSYLRTWEWPVMNGLDLCVSNDQ